MAIGCGRVGLVGETPTGSQNPTASPTPTNPNGYELPLTIPGGLIADDLAAFPVWVELSLPELRHVAQGGHVLDADGADFVFEQSGTALPTESIYYDANAGGLGAWVLLDLNQGVDETFLLRYGEPGLIGTQSTAPVWTDNFAAVWHLEEEMGGRGNPGVVADSTANQLDADDNTAAAANKGPVGYAAHFNSDQDYLAITGVNNRLDSGGLNVGRSDDFTVQSWIQVNQLTGQWDTIIEKGVASAAGGWGFYFERVGTPATLAVYLENNQSNQARIEVAFDPTLGTWYHVAAVVNRGDPDEVEFYVDGVSIGTDTSGAVAEDNSDTQGDVTIGNNTTVSPCCPVRGALDELWISTGRRSAQWIETTYTNQATPSAFVVPGTEIAL